ncbi:PREDICTED: disks large-associated protein 5 isoform X1 [Cyprinodon variegatus]|nr:PREDICTED: disks large-associated protein 5 isoform X1 [Cyprinodon variegatus]
MESRFADLRWRDTSVSMLRVKQSRRRSQSQKENRERLVNARRQLEKLPEMDISSLDASIMTANMSTIQEKTQLNPKPVKTAALDRLKRLQSWKEQKELKKEKERREKEAKGVFKIGLYQPKDTFTLAPLPAVPLAASKVKELKKVSTAAPQSTRVTRSMKQPQQEQKKPLATQHPNTRTNKAQPAAATLSRSRAAPVKPASAATMTSAGYPAASGPTGRATSTRSATRPAVTKAPVVKDNPKAKCADVRATRNIKAANPSAPPSKGVRNCKAVSVTPQPDDHQEVGVTESQIEEQQTSICPPSPTPCPEENNDVANPDPAVASAPSFAPEGFLFQAPSGLSSFKFEPLTPRSADAFLTPSPSFNLPAAPVFSAEAPAECEEPLPPQTPSSSSLHTSPTSGSPQELKHDVPYFRSEISNETDRLTSLCLHWESKVEDESIPEEMRDRMRTAVGQARLLMKERFNQFSGLVDDCELGRGEKITTCTDLQGFWDMVYFQVEDVQKKFDSLKEAESRGWMEEQKLPPRRRKVKTTSVAPTKPTGNKTAARSRLAAVKAAMKARQEAAEAEKTSKDADVPQPQVEGQTVVFDGGFFQVESPAKPSVLSVRRSSRLSAAALPCASPCSSYFSPRRVTRRSLALAQTSVEANASPAQPVHSAERFCLTLEHTPRPKSQPGTPQMSQKKSHTANLSPVKDVLSEEAQSVQSPQPSEISSPAEQVPMETKPSVCPTPDGSIIEEIPGLDFERYLQPSLRCSLSPRGSVAVEMLSMGTDVEMESPKGEAEELLTHLEPAPSAASLVSTPQTPQTAASALLLFTPDLTDRIRQSTCPSDLMVFTPPMI